MDVRDPAERESKKEREREKWRQREKYSEDREERQRWE